MRERYDSRCTGATVHALLIDGPLAHQNARVADPLPDLVTIEATRNGSEAGTVESHAYRKVGFEPNRNGNPLAIYSYEG